MKELVLGLLTLAVAKIFDNILLTTKSLTTYQNRRLLSSTLVVLSQFMFYLVIKEVISDSSVLSVLVVSLSSGIGTYIAFGINDRFKKRCFIYEHCYKWGH